ncbi:MAG: N-6 DNA methylase [Clostridiaceae bacterium]|nr:N-6 DNA methylase [Clostridiaceae bacterium]
MNSKYMKCEGFNLRDSENRYSDEMIKYEKAIDKKYKKSNGVFYTDLFLAKKMLEELDVSSEMIILDPCCGTGSFLFAAQYYGFSSIYGSDQDRSAVDFVNKHVPNAKVTVFDTIGRRGSETLKALGLEKEADVVVGNPPYAPLNNDTQIIASDYLFLRKVQNSGNNLFVAGIIRAMEIAKEGGIISYIIPKNFLHVDSYSLLRKEILSTKTIVSIVDIGAYFKNVRGEQIIITIMNSKPSKNGILFKKLSNNNFEYLCKIDQEFYSDEILLFNSVEEFSIYKKLKYSFQMLKDVRSGYVGRGKSSSAYAVTGKDIRKFGYKNRKCPTSGNKIFIQNIYSSESGIIAAMGGEFEASETVTVFTDGDELMCRYILGFLHSRLCNFYLYKFCYNNSKLTMHTDSKYLKRLPLNTGTEYCFKQVINTVEMIEQEEYLSNSWHNYIELLNQIVYKAYEITETEIALIDREMKKIQSKRWQNNG